MYLFPVLRRLHEQIDSHIFISEASRYSFLSAPNTKWTDYSDYKRQMRFLPYRSTHIKNSLILHNGVDLRLFHPIGIRKDSKTFVIGCIGNFVELKDQITLIKAVERISKESNLNMRVKFVGSGSTLRECKEYIIEHGLSSKFEFLPEVWHEELPEFYSSIDLFVLPSCFEGFGCVYAEAYACKVPFIACEGQGIAEMIAPNERNLWLAKRRDPEDLAQKIWGYFHNRKVQNLNSTIDIEELIRKFIIEIEL